MNKYLGVLGCFLLALGCATTSGGSQPSGAGDRASSPDLKEHFVLCEPPTYRVDADTGAAPPDSDEAPSARGGPATGYAIDLSDRGVLLEELGRGARARPEYTGDTFDGVRLSGIRPGSIYERCGMLDGDLIRRINGLIINSPVRMEEAYEAVKVAGQATVEFLRGDEPMTLRAVRPTVP